MIGAADDLPVVVRISGQGIEPTGAFRVRVSFGDAAEYDQTVIDPASGGSEELFVWYFEEHLRYPFLDKDWEQEAVAAIDVYGESLFAQVTSGKAYVDYRRLRDRGFDGCRIEVSGPADLHRLHWEALRDPDLPMPLTACIPVTRRVTSLESKFDPHSERATLNVLIVTARPHGRRDVGYRTLSRPLLDAVRTAGLPVTVDLVRPGTWEALTAHLRAATEAHGTGWYQIVHFDVHGAFEDYQALVEGREASRLQFGSKRLVPFEGRRGFVFFETAETGKAGPVSAEDVAGLLAEHRVPVAVLNACQSAMQNDSEAGLAQRLVEAGIPVAVGMAYSVTVTAAEQAMPVLYRKIAEGAELTAAVLAARRHLLDYPARHAYFDQELDLADWMLPVMFAQRPLQIALRPMDDAEHTQFFERAAVVGDEPETEYGFVGRDLDIQAIEHAILTDSNLLLIQGMAGAGKSTLLAHLAWWWQRTGLVDQVFRFSYEDRAWTAAQIVHQIRSRLLSRAERDRGNNMSEAAQAEQVAGLLRATRHLLILDNTESITAVPAAIPHALDPDERQKLKTLLGRLRGGRTLVLLGSREAESWLGTDAAGIGIYPLPGLDGQATSTLVDRILRRHHAAAHLTDPVERAALDELVTLLGGYPLPLTVVLPVLAADPPSVVLAELQAGGEAADPAGLIHQTVEYSHGKLDPALQSSLQLLAPFTAVIPTGPILQHYQELLAADESVRDLGPLDLAAALDHAIAVGLAAPHDQLTHLAQIQPVLPWFLRSRLHGQPALQSATAQAHYQHYAGFAGQLRGMLLSLDSPQQRQIGHIAVRAEYANLTVALTHALRTSQPVNSLITALDEYLDQTRQHDARRHLLEVTITAYPMPASRAQQLELAVLHDLAGHAALTQDRLDAANTHYQAELKILHTLGERKGQGVIYLQLGNLALKQRRFDDAQASYRRALAIYRVNERHETAEIHHNLGMVAQQRRRLDEAEACYRQALEVKLEFNDQHSAARTYRELGNLALELGQLNDAETSYREALHIYQKFRDWQSLAGIHHNLGTVAQKQQRLEDAETSYRKALDIHLESGNQDSAATTYHNLGTVALELGRLDEAEANYRRALDIKTRSSTQHDAADTYLQLGIVAKERGQFDQAQASYRQALDIYLKSGDQHAAADTFHHLGTVAFELQQFDDAEANLHKALDIRLDSGGQDEIAAIHHNLGMVAQEQGKLDEAEASFRQALDIYLESGDQRRAAGTYHQLGTVAQERRWFGEAEAYYREALDIYRESGNQDSAADTHHNLGMVAQEQGKLDEAEASYRSALYSYLSSGNERGAANTDHYLGRLAQERLYGEGRSVANTESNEIGD